MPSRRTVLRTSATVALGALAGCNALPFTDDEESDSAIITASGVHRQAGFGNAVALDGETMVVGARHALNRAGEFGGATFVYEHSDGDWTKETWLQPPGEDLAGPMTDEARLSFGSYVATVDGTVVVGTADAPAAYLYERSGDGWQLEARCYPDTIDAKFRRCNSLAFDGETLAMSTLCRPEDDEPAVETVHVFEQRDFEWQEVASLQHGNTPKWDLFGYGVAVDNGTLVVGGTEAGSQEPDARQCVVRVYERGRSGWRQQSVIRPESAYTFGGTRAARSIDVAGDTFVVGDLQSLESSEPSRTFVFRRSGGSWGREAILRPDALSEASFGAPLALREDTLLAAAEGATVDTEVRGSAFRYERSAADWTVAGRLSDREAVRPGRFGFDIALSEDRIAVGARVRRDDIADQEAVYVFPR